MQPTQRVNSIRYRQDNNFTPFPRNKDVLCGKNKACFTHEGSRCFRAIIDFYLERYQKSSTKQEKMNITKEIFEYIQFWGSRFLKYDTKTKTWRQISEVEARDKISHALRFANRQRERRSKKVKKQLFSLPHPAFSPMPTTPPTFPPKIEGTAPKDSQQNQNVLEKCQVESSDDSECEEKNISDRSQMDSLTLSNEEDSECSNEEMLFCQFMSDPVFLSMGDDTHLQAVKTVEPIHDASIITSPIDVPNSPVSVAATQVADFPINYDTRLHEEELVKLSDNLSTATTSNCRMDAPNSPISVVANEPAIFSVGDYAQPQEQRIHNIADFSMGEDTRLQEEKLVESIHNDNLSKATTSNCQTDAPHSSKSAVVTEASVLSAGDNTQTQEEHTHKEHISHTFTNCQIGAPSSTETVISSIDNDTQSQVEKLVEPIHYDGSSVPNFQMDARISPKSVAETEETEVVESINYDGSSVPNFQMDAPNSPISAAETAETEETDSYSNYFDFKTVIMKEPLLEWFE